MTTPPSQPTNEVDWSKGPFRLCCGKQHYGPICPDGRVMCCLCFDVVEQSQLNKTADGKLEDVCKSCVEKEMQRKKNYERTHQRRTRCGEGDNFMSADQPNTDGYDPDLELRMDEMMRDQFRLNGESYDNYRKLSVENDQLRAKVGELESIIDYVKSHKMSHVVCDCDYGCDGRERLKGKPCPLHNNSTPSDSYKRLQELERYKKAMEWLDTNWINYISGPATMPASASLFESVSAAMNKSTEEKK